MGEITIGFVPRERFSAAPRSLRSIFEHTHLPFHLIVVDSNTPPRYREEMMSILDGRSNVDVIRTDEYMLTNQAKNLVVETNENDYLALVENDVIVRDRWLTHLLEALEEHPADVATPLILEDGEVHYDRRIASLRRVPTPEGEKIEFVKRPGDWEEQRGGERRTTLTTEVHALLFRKEVFDAIGPFDEQLTTRREVDFFLELYERDIPIVFEPKSVIEFCSPPPVRRDEKEFYMMTWDAEAARRSNDRIEEKWELVELPRSENFARERRRWHTSHLRYRLLEFAKRVRAKSLYLRHKGMQRLESLLGRTE